MLRSGTAVVLGDDVDTDIIFPGRYLAVLDPVDQAKHLFEPLGAEIRERIMRGKVVVGGWNFGCGSSREHAVTAMIGAGVCLVIGKSFSRIFYRNAINLGLAVVIAPDFVATISDRDIVSVDLATGSAETGGRRFAFPRLPAELQRIVSAGGLWAARTA